MEHAIFNSHSHMFLIIVNNEGSSHEILNSIKNDDQV